MTSLIERYTNDGYHVLSYDDAYSLAKDYIEGSLWAFNSSFLSEETGFPEIIFTSLSGLCEDANDAVLVLIKGTCGLDRLVNSAIGLDGLGHFLNSYDGEAIEFEDGGEDYVAFLEG